MFLLLSILLIFNFFSEYLYVKNRHMFSAYWHSIVEMLIIKNIFLFLCVFQFHCQLPCVLTCALPLLCTILTVSRLIILTNLNICSVDFSETRPAGITRGHEYKLRYINGIRVVLLGPPSFLNGLLIHGTIFQLTLTFHHPSPLNVK